MPPTTAMDASRGNTVRITATVKLSKNRSIRILSEEELALPVPCFKHPLAALYMQHTQPH